MAKLKLWWSKLENRRRVINILLIIIGSFVTAAGIGMFLTPNVNNPAIGDFSGINSGGLSGIGIIIQNWTGLPVDATVAILTVLLFFIGLAVLGKDFAMKTLLASILFPLFLSLIIRVDAFQAVATQLYRTDAGTLPGVANILIGGIIGGAITGVGIGLTFLGGGSTGGVDILAFIMNKYLHIKTSSATFILDGTVVAIGMFVMGSDYVVVGLIGIITAVICSLTINFVFSGKSEMYNAKIISNEWEQINTYIQNEMERGSTISNVEGGYQFKEYRQVSVAFSRDQYAGLIAVVAEIDPKAFIVIEQLQNVYGEGFNALERNRLRRGKKHKQITEIHETKDE